MAEHNCTKFRVLLVEDHEVFRQALALAFQLEDNLDVVAQAGSLAGARMQLESPIDVAVLDLELPDGNGLTLIPELKAANPGAEVLILTASVHQLALARAVEAGAAGLLHKSTALVAIVDAVQRLGAGGLLVTQRELIELVQLAGRERETLRANAQAIASLTPRERDVLHALGAGLGDREIAQHLSVATETIHTHMTSVMRKLGVKSRMQALIVAIKRGIVTLD
jgi:DNA-binding NarL/FixJ family response regulator